VKKYLLGKRMSSGRSISWEERRVTRKEAKWKVKSEKGERGKKKEGRGEGKEKRVRKGTYDNDTHTSPHNFDNY
jgi:hypothetical protein